MLLANGKKRQGTQLLVFRFVYIDINIITDNYITYIGLKRSLIVPLIKEYHYRNIL